MELFTHKEDYLMEKFSKITPETLAKPVIAITEEDIESSKETIDNLEDVLGNTDLLNKAADEAKTQDKTSLRDKLKNNSNNC
jgi:chaperonin GroEL (HSP60 family)